MTGLWFKRSCQLCQDPDIQAVALVHGPGTITVFEELMALSKLTKGYGFVITTWDVLMMRSFTKRAKCGAIVTALERQGLLERDEELTGGKTLAVTIPGWARWNPKDPTGAERKARQRARDAAETVFPSRDKSRNGHGASQETTVPRVRGREREQNTVATPTVPGSVDADRSVRKAA